MPASTRLDVKPSGMNRPVLMMRLGTPTGFVALDYENKLRVNLLKPALTAARKENAQGSKASRLLPPNEGDIFDRVAACQGADRLVSLCSSLPPPPKGLSITRISGHVVRNRHRVAELLPRAQQVNLTRVCLSRRRGFAAIFSAPAQFRIGGSLDRLLGRFLRHPLWGS